LKCISGFSSSNYLEQPYNSDLDFGTGDFSISMWLKISPNTNSEFVFDRAHWTTTYVGAVIRAYVNSAGLLVVNISDDAFASADSITSTVAIDDSTFKSINVVRRGGTVQIWINGILNVSTTLSSAVASLSNTSAILKWGVKASLSEPLTNGSLALWRISATAPSAEQIKEIYEAEKPMFQANAKCTLNGSSDAVTALAYDDDTELLHVGTSGGRSVFQGLRRVDETSTSTTEIAAQGGLIVEET